MHNRVHTALVCLTALVAMSVPADASPGRSVATVTADTPITVAGDLAAWSKKVGKSYRLQITSPAASGGKYVTTEAAAAPSPRPFDASGAVTSGKRALFLYSRCQKTVRERWDGIKRESGCDIYRYDAASRKETKLSAVSSPTADEAWPVMAGNTIAFVRRATARWRDGYDHRPSTNGKGVIGACDMPYAGKLGRPSSVRRLDRSECGTTIGMTMGQAPSGAITLIQVTDIDQGGAGSESQLRRLPVTGARAVILDRAGGGEGGYSPFASPSLTSTSLWLTRTGSRQHIEPGVIRITSPASRRPKYNEYHDNSIAGRFVAQDGGHYWMLRGTNGGDEQSSYDAAAYCTEQQPCQLIRANGSPASVIRQR